MATKQKTDQFANIAYLEVQESEANKLTFKQLQLATTLMTEKAALIIHRAEFYCIDLAQLNSSGDTANMALTLSDRITDIVDQSQPEVLFFQRITRLDHGTAASSHFVHFPFTRDFTQLPGGGLIVPADRLYAAMMGSGAGAAMTLKMRLYYTVQPLEVSQYWELIEARRVMTT